MAGARAAMRAASGARARTQSARINNNAAFFSSSPHQVLLWTTTVLSASGVAATEDALYLCRETVRGLLFGGGE
jgi:hypothetical protein